jgi:import inner membrane translocase subunit TIM54
LQPILIAAAIDFEMIGGKRHGDLANKIADEIKKQRRIAVGIDPPPPVMQALANYQPLDVMYRRKLEGGIIIIGRPTFKEFMAGTKRGWTEGLEKIDREEALLGNWSRTATLTNRKNTQQSMSRTWMASRYRPHQSYQSGKGIYSPLQMQRTPPPPRTSEAIPAAKNSPPATIPELPPILFVPFINLLALRRSLSWFGISLISDIKSGLAPKQPIA